MAGLGPRLIAFGFIGAFCLVGPLFLLIALNSALHRAVFVHTALRAEGTVIEMRPTHSTRHDAGMDIPVFRFTGDDGRTYIIVSDVSAHPSSFFVGEQVAVLYQRGHPETARLDAFAPLWLFSLIFGIVGAAFTSLPALIFVNRMRQRRRALIQAGPETI